MLDGPWDLALGHRGLCHGTSCWGSLLCDGPSLRAQLSVPGLDLGCTLVVPRRLRGERKVSIVALGMKKELAMLENMEVMEVLTWERGSGYGHCLWTGKGDVLSAMG